MRIRRKKNLETRLAATGSLLIAPQVEEKNFTLAAQEKDPLPLETLFGRKAPLHLEIGCGKGRFAAEYAKQHPEADLLADARLLPRFLPQGAADVIFLNFSCPFPKGHQRNLRLTNPSFLEMYKELLSENGRIEQKTDNAKFFEFSLNSFCDNDFRLRNITFDLHNKREFLIFSHL